MDQQTAETAPADPVLVTVIIKALNEERHIEAAVRSAITAVAPYNGEVILADSGSSDDTVEIACRLGIRVVQLANFDERRCGVGPQLGYEIANGTFIYILDGDMELEPTFLAAALAAFEAEPELGGVAGLVTETSEASYQFRGRKKRDREGQVGQVDWLDMGGLYRRAAVEQTGYLSDRNLHAYEEQDLGLRLGAHGWRLKRLELPGIVHHGHTESSLKLLFRRWQNRYLDGAGELLRASVNKPYLGTVVRSLRHLFAGLAIWLAALMGLLLLPVTALPLLAVIATVCGLIAIRYRRGNSLADAAFAQVVWQVTALAMLRGFFIRKHNPADPIAKQIIA